MKAPRGLGPRKRGGAEAPYKHFSKQNLGAGRIHSARSK